MEDKKNDENNLSIEIKDYDDALKLIEAYDFLKESFEKGNVNGKDELPIDRITLKRIQINNYLLDIIKFVEKIELNNVNEKFLDSFINKVFEGVIYYKGKIIKNLTDIEEKKDAIVQFRNCIAHAHYSISVVDKLKVNMKRKGLFESSITEDELKKIVENLILFFKDNTPVYLSHLSDFSYSGYELNVLIDTLYNKESDIYGKEENVLGKITPKKYATLLQSYNFYFSYLFERRAMQKNFAPSKYMTSTDLLIEHPPKIGQEKSDDNSQNRIYLTDFELTQLNEERLNKVLYDFYGYFQSMTAEMKEEYNISDIDQILTQLDEYFDGKISMQELNLSRILEIYMPEAPRILRVKNNKLGSRAKDVFANFANGNKENKTFVWPKLEDLVKEETDWSEKKYSLLEAATDKAIDKEIARLRKLTGKKSPNDKLIGILDPNDSVEGAFLDVLDFKLPYKDRSTYFKNMIRLNEEDTNHILKLQNVCSEIEKSSTYIDSNKNRIHYDYSKLFEGIRNAVSHGNIDIDYSDYYINGVLYKVIEDDGTINFENIRYTFQDFDNKKGITTFLIMNLRGEDLNKIIEDQRKMYIKEREDYLKKQKQIDERE